MSRKAISLEKYFKWRRDASISPKHYYNRKVSKNFRSEMRYFIIKQNNYFNAIYDGQIYDNHNEKIVKLSSSRYISDEMKRSRPELIRRKRRCFILFIENASSIASWNRAMKC